MRARYQALAHVIGVRLMIGALEREVPLQLVEVVVLAALAG